MNITSYALERPSFVPQRLVIELHNEEDYKLLCDLFCYDVTVPQAIYPHDDINRTRLEEIMMEIFQNIASMKTKDN